MMVVYTGLTFYLFTHPLLRPGGICLLQDRCRCQEMDAMSSAGP